MTRINREALLHQLECVQSGISSKGAIDQSSCFVFQDGRVFTYNDEVACFHKTSLKQLKGAVQAAPLLSILSKLKEEEIEISEATSADSKAELILTGKKRETGIRLDSEILLPIGNVDKPGSWSDLHDEFGDAVALVKDCASRDESEFGATCIHVTPKFIEAQDGEQAARYKLKSGFASSFTIKKTTLENIIPLGMTKFSETANWIHFKNPEGLVLSCRRHEAEFKELGHLFKATGEPITLPKGLAEACANAEVFSSENKDKNNVFVDLKEGWLKIRGEGVSGWHKERKKVKYSGPKLSFYIPPATLVTLTKNHNECEITPDFLKVTQGRFTYITSLGVEEEAADSSPVDSSSEGDDE